MSVSHRNTALLAVLALVLSACADETTNPSPDVRIPRQFSEGVEDLTVLANASGGPEAFLANLNQVLAGQGAGYAVRGADLLLATTADPNFKSTVLANDRTHRLGYQFVAGDPRRGTIGSIVRQASFLPFRFAPTGPGTRVDAKPSVDASFATWNGVNCSKLTVVNNTLPANVFPSAVLGLGGGFINNPLLSDINTVGFLPGVIFDLVFGPGASTFVLGVTLPFTFIDAEGNPTDINGDGDDDLAFAEIWYNAAFRWTNTGTGTAVDIESVTLHENGHALGLGHFGKLSVKNGALKASPSAVMNASYDGALRSPLGTDNGSYCSYWASWPN